MTIYNNSKGEKTGLMDFEESDYQDLIIALEEIYHVYWDLFDKNFRQKCQKELVRLIDYLYHILTEREGLNKSHWLSIGDIELILIIIDKALELKISTNLKNAQECLSCYYKSFYSQFDIIIKNEG